MDVSVGPGLIQRLGRFALISLVIPLMPAIVMGQGRQQPALPANRPEIFDPDPASCVVEKMRMAYQRQLEPFQDQSAAVLQRLRSVQAEMTLASLRRCVQRGLMPEEEAIRLARELGLIPAASAASTRQAPQGSGASTRP
ncbi:MAG: hypothetical protein VKI63_05935 [Cyanobium sp.]|nr:hypothetical protein [Cyanobium sp.]